MVAFYNAADQELYKDYQFVPQEKYRTGFTAPTTEEEEVTESFGIPNTNAFTNSGDNSFNSAGNVFGYGSQIEPVSYGQYGAPGYMGGLPGNVQQYGIGRQFEDPSASPIGETYSYKKTVPGFARVAAGFIPFGNTALNFLEKRMNSNRDQSGSYSVAGLSEAQKGAYNNLAGAGMLFDGPSGLKTLTGKNFTGKGYMEGQIELAKEFGFDNMTDEEIEDAIEAQGLANQNKFNTKNKGFKYKQMLEASKMFKTNKLKEKKEAQDDDGTPPNADGSGFTGSGNFSNIDNSGKTYGPHSQDGGNQNQGGGSNIGGANEGNPGANQSNQGHSQHHAKGGRVGYFFGGRVNYKTGGRINFRGGGMDMGNEENQKQSAEMGNTTVSNNNNDGGNNTPPTLYNDGVQVITDQTKMGFNYPTGLTKNLGIGQLTAILDARKSLEEEDLEGKLQYDSSIGPINTTMSYDTTIGPEFNASYNNNNLNANFNTNTGLSANYSKDIGPGTFKAGGTYSPDGTFNAEGKYVISYANGGLASIL